MTPEVDLNDVQPVYVVHYEVEGFLAEESELGAVASLDMDDRTVQLELPFVRGGGFRRYNEIRNPRPACDLLIDWESRRLVVIRSIQVRIDLSDDKEICGLLLDSAAASPPFSNPAVPNAIAPISRTAAEAMTVFARAARNFSGQYWLSLEHQVPRIDGRGVVADAGSDGGFPDTAFGRPAQFGMPRTLDPIHVKGFLETVESAGVREPALVDTFLGDAEFLHHYAVLNRGSKVEEEPDVDWRQSLVLAAMALEAEMKALLRRYTADDQKGELEKVLRKRPRAIALFRSLSREFLGRSLEDEPAEFGDALEQLFNLRNAVIHEGVAPSNLEANPALAAGVAARDWLRDLNAELDGLDASRFLLDLREYGIEVSGMDSATARDIKVILPPIENLQ